MSLALRKWFYFGLFNLLVGLQISFAQPGNPGGNPDVPITGIEYIIGLGGLYGIRKILATSKTKK